MRVFPMREREITFDKVTFIESDEGAVAEISLQVAISKDHGLCFECVALLPMIVDAWTVYQSIIRTRISVECPVIGFGI